MGNEIVRNIQELQMANQLFWQRTKNAQKFALVRMSELNVQESKKLLEIARPAGYWKGTLLNSIHLEQINQFKVRVYASDYGKGGENTAEIEYGLTPAEFRKYAENPFLKQWAMEKLGHAPGTGIMVGGPNSIVHPKGLHYFEQGFKFTHINADLIINEELNKAER